MRIWKRPIKIKGLTFFSNSLDCVLALYTNFSYSGPSYFKKILFKHLQYKPHMPLVLLEKSIRLSLIETFRIACRKTLKQIPIFPFDTKKEPMALPTSSAGVMVFCC